MAEMTDLRRAYLMGYRNGLKTKCGFDATVDKIKNEIDAKMRDMEMKLHAYVRLKLLPIPSAIRRRR